MKELELKDRSCLNLFFLGQVIMTVFIVGVVVV